jgi:long-subunit fatty acid transport protein
MAKSYNQVSLALKMDLNDKLSLGLSLDPTYGVDIDYPAAATGYYLRGTTATIDGDSIVVAGRYKFNDNFSVHAGLRSVGVGGNVLVVRDGTPAYQATFASDRDVGYLVGAAYEKPEIALRVALTYSSATQHDLAASVAGTPAGTVPVELPQSVALDFQSGVAKDTLVFGQVRWSDWTATEFNGPLYPANPLIGYDNDVVSYSLGVGRRFSDAWSGAITLGYEDAKGGIASNFSPTDGSKSIGIGATYTSGNMKITGGIRYVDLGDSMALGGAAAFSENHAIGVGLKIGFSF